MEERCNKDEYMQSIMLDETNIKKRKTAISFDAEDESSSDIDDDRVVDRDWSGGEEIESDDGTEGEYNVLEDRECVDNPEQLLDNPHNYIAEIELLFKSHDIICCGSALTLNKEMQKYLFKIRDRIQEMLFKIKKQYTINERELKTCSQSKRRTTARYDLTSSGSQYFKDLNGKRCPFNCDYAVRCSQGEFFPMDLSIRPFHHWTLVDKMGIIQGIKEQIIDYLDHKKRSQSKTVIEKNIKLHTLKLEELLSEVDDAFHIDWHQISVNSLKDRHTASSCHGMWIQYLHPDIDRKKWSKEEEMKLYNIAKKYNFQNWTAIAAEHKNRSEYQCFLQYQTSIKGLMQSKFNKWTKEDDLRLLQIVNKYKMNGVIPWNRVASHFPERSKQQVHCRYIYSINPEINHGSFTPEEDCILLAAVEEYGEKFHCLPKSLFPKRTVVQLRNRYLNCLKKRNKCTFWTADDDQRLLDLVNRLGISNWKKISEEIGNHTRTSCRTRYFTITKYLKDHPETSLDRIPRKKRLTNTDVNKDNWVEKIIELQQNQHIENTTTTTKTNKESVNRKTNLKPKNRKIYRGSLRPLELKFYDFFKYSYDFRLGKEFNRCMTSTKSLEYVRLICYFKLPPVLQIDDALPEANIAVYFKLYADNNASRKDLSQIIDIKPGRLLPPNWSTMMGFRALCIESGGAEQQYYAIMHETNTADAVQIFRMRLKAIFLRTAILSRIDPEAIYNTLIVELKNNEDVTDPPIFNDIIE